MSLSIRALQSLHHALHPLPTRAFHTSPVARAARTRFYQPPRQMHINVIDYSSALLKLIAAASTLFTIWNLVKKPDEKTASQIEAPYNYKEAVRATLTAPPITNFQEEKIGRALLDAYRNELVLSENNVKLEMIQLATNIRFDLTTGSIVFVDASGKWFDKTPTIYTIAPSDLKALSLPDNSQTVEKIAKEWSAMPITTVATFKPHLYLQAASVHSQAPYIQKLCKKHSMLFVTTDPTDRDTLVVKYSLPFSNSSEIAVEQHFSLFVTEFDTTVKALAALDKHLPLTEESEKLWEEELKQNPLYLDCAALFFPKVKAYFDTMLLTSSLERLKL